MSRAVPAAVATALESETVQPFYAVEMLFDTAPLRIWTGYGDRTIDGEVYTGAGTLLGISGLEEVSSLEAKSAELVLSGVESSIIATALAEPYQGRTCRVLFGVRDVADFVVVFSGLMDTMRIDDNGATCEVTLTVESKLVTLERPRVRRYTHESQQQLFPGDTFFSYVADLQDKEIVWGRKANNA